MSFKSFYKMNVSAMTCVPYVKLLSLIDKEPFTGRVGKYFSLQKSFVSLRLQTPLDSCSDLSFAGRQVNDCYQFTRRH